MPHVIGTLLLHTTATPDTFRIFFNLALLETMHAFYTHNLEFIHSYTRVFWKVAKDLSPKFFATLRELQIEGALFLNRWVTSLFSLDFPIGVCALLWDNIFMAGEHQILRAALAICLALH
jgi:hypothetical protein